MTKHDINTSYTELSKVTRHLEKGKLHSHAVRPKDKSIYKSPVYAVWHLVYDNQNRPCQNFYKCSNCLEVHKVELSASGNKKLSRHLCYVAYKKHIEGKEEAENKKKNEQSSSDDDNETEEVGKIIEKFSKFCQKHGAISEVDAANCAPKKWRTKDW